MKEHFFQWRFKNTKNTFIFYSVSFCVLQWPLCVAKHSFIFFSAPFCVTKSLFRVLQWPFCNTKTFPFSFQRHAVLQKPHFVLHNEHCVLQKTLLFSFQCHFVFRKWYFKTQKGLYKTRSFVAGVENNPPSPEKIFRKSLSINFFCVFENIFAQKRGSVKKLIISL